jgi:hypothetical protein
VRKWAIRVSWLGASFIVAFTLAYGATTYKIVANSPFGLNLSKPSDPTERVFAKMVRLGEADAVLRDCGTANRSTDHPSSRATLLDSQAQLLNELRSDAPSAGLAPPLDLAQAILSMRRDGAPEPLTGGNSVTLGELLKRSGWPENSENLLRQVQVRMDKSCK